MLTNDNSGWRGGSNAEPQKFHQSNNMNGGGGNNYNKRENTNSSSDEKPTKIVLINCPLDLSPEAVRKWCSEYGTVIEVRFTSYNASKLFFVDYSNFAEANNALRKINESNAFNVKCEFSRQKKKDGKTELNNSGGTTVNGNYSRNRSDDTGRNGYGKKPQYNNGNETRETRNDFGNANYRSTNEKRNDQEGNYKPTNKNYRDNHNENPRPNRSKAELTYSEIQVNFEPKFFPNTTLAPNAESNFLTKFNQMTTQKTAPLKNNYPEPVGNVKVPSDRNTKVATPNFKEPELKSNVTETSVDHGKRSSCINCKKESKFMCERCKCFYCSHECQTEDWPFHKTVCNELPRLIPVKINYTKNYKILDKPEESDELKPAVKNGSPKNVKVPQKSKDSKNSSIGSPPLQSQIKTVVPPQPQIKTVTPPQPEAIQKTPDHPNKVEIDKIDSFYEHQSAMDKMLANPNSGIAFKINQFADNLPKQISRPEPPKQVHIFGDFPKNRSPVVITAVISPETVYIRSLASKDHAAYCQLVQDVDLCSASAKGLVQLPAKGDMVLADYQGIYNRAIVLKPINKEVIHIAYLDFGNMDIKHLDELKELKSDLQKVPRYTFRVLLKNIAKSAMPDDAVTYLNDLCTGITELELRYESEDILDKDKKNCELYDPAANIVVNEKVNSLMEIKPPGENDKIIMFPDIPARTIPAGKNVEVVVRDNSLLSWGIISVATIECEKDMMALSTEINRYCNALNETGSYTPRSQEACLVHYEPQKSWFRALCIDTTGDGHPTVQLIDIGNFTNVSIKMIKKFPAKFAKVPFCAITMYIRRVPEHPTPEQESKLMNIFQKNKKVLLDEVELLKVEDGNPEEGEETNFATVKILNNYFP